MKILLTNDDGIDAPGLAALFAPLSAVGHAVTVAAPACDHSGVGHAITVHQPIFVDEYEFDRPDIHGWSIKGYPADCVKIAVEELLDGMPDLVISGINRGANLGQDALCSGTIQAALEASMHNIPALSVSLDSKSPKADYTLAVATTLQVAEKYTCFGLPVSTMLNVNVPSMPKEQVKGLKIARLGDSAYDNIFAPRKDLNGRTYYWLGGSRLTNNGKNKDLDIDVDAVGEGWITLTPLHYDLVNHAALIKMKSLPLDDIF